jgi:hypothetical protein
MRTKILIFISTLCLISSAFAEDKMTEEQKAAMQARAKEVNASCDYPEKPTIPEGRNSTEEEMLQAQSRMKAFIADGNDYIACLDKLEASWGEDADDNDHALIVVLHNKAVDDMQSVADLFNTAVRAFKGKK